MSHERASHTVAVIKLGGSIFERPESYRAAAQFLANLLSRTKGGRFAVVVSAQQGATDALLGEARLIADEPNRAALDLLWSTGELRSVALLALHLQALGISSAPLSVHEAGLRVRGANANRAAASVQGRRIIAALQRSAVVIVPGFLATNEFGTVVSLGRGGSDLTAVILAEGLGASRCELVKDVAGYFSRDPHLDALATHIPELSYETAISMAGAGCDLVQPQALQAAQRARIELIVRSLDPRSPCSRITAASVAEEQKLAPEISQAEEGAPI